jgi:hypothetical protein
VYLGISLGYIRLDTCICIKVIKVAG